MKVIYLERGKGKTTELIKICDKTGYYIVCPTQRECGMIFQMAKDMKCNINFPMTYQEFVGGHYGPFVKGILIDNVDMFLRKMSKVPIIAVSITKEEETEVKT